jgi:hypothetical protein
MGRQIKWSEFFDSTSLGALQQIFDFAWKEIRSRPGSLFGIENDEQRQNDLAQMIILALRSGMQPEEIKASILGRVPFAKTIP